MNVDRIVHSVAGTFILASLALAHWHSPNWLWFTAFVGANLLQSGAGFFVPLGLSLTHQFQRQCGVSQDIAPR